MAAHVFVVPGTLEALHCDDVVVSTDQRGPAGVRRHWWRTLGWDGAVPERQRIVPLDDEHRYLRLDPDGRAGGGPSRWLLHVGASAGGDVEWLRDGMRQVLQAVADSGETPAGRPRRIALPVVGVGGGGHGRRRGAVIRGLLEEAQKAPDGLDVVIVAASRSDYSALQAQRRAMGLVPLPGRQDALASRLAARARSGDLALFMGAGTGVAAGLPTWRGLLSAVARRMDVPGGVDALMGLNPLDAAEVLRRLAGAPASGGGRRPAGKSLGEHVVDALGNPTRYALGHVLLASLGVEQVVTTNFDDLYERAVKAVTGREVPLVLPGADPRATLSRDRSWLVKMHGDARRPHDIVLDRRSFVRYDATQRPLASVLQATLMTKHLLVVGASMTDDNVIRLVHEVASLNEDHRSRTTMGTLLMLERDDLTARLWHPEFESVAVGPAAPAEESDDERYVRMTAAGRDLEILLDRIAVLASRESAHLLDRRYADLLDHPAERELAEELARLTGRVRKVAGTTRRTSEWQDVLDALHRWGAHERP
ncbi:SIR2 family protein [Geodermatophilus sp. SYSU D00525]